MQNLYSVKDKVSKTYIRPFTMDTDRDAIEGFRGVVNDEKSNYNKFPEDFCLVKLGKFDPREGQIQPSPPIELMWADKLIEKK